MKRTDARSSARAVPIRSTGTPPPAAGNPSRAIPKSPTYLYGKSAEPWKSRSREIRTGGELRSLYEHLQARILEMIETLDDLRASAEMEIFREIEKDEKVIDRIAAAQREELEQEIGELEFEAKRVKMEIVELVGNVPF